MSAELATGTVAEYIVVPIEAGESRHPFRQVLMSPNDEVSPGSKATHDPVENFALKTGLEIGEREVAAQDQVERSIRHRGPNISLTERDTGPAVRLHAPQPVLLYQGASEP
jgi:hypothetical protein